jgi:hypothetical protein
MITTLEQAMQVAQNHLDEKSRGKDDGLQILEDKVVEKKYGWIFRFNSKKFLETGNILYSLGGNGPIVVERESGKIHELGSAMAFDETVKEFEDYLGLLG